MNGTLYTGVTSDLVKRGDQHRHGLIDGFSMKYGCKRLVADGFLGPAALGPGFRRDDGVR